MTLIEHIINNEVIKHDRPRPGKRCRCYTVPFNPADLRTYLEANYTLGDLDLGLTFEQHLDLIIATSVRHGNPTKEAA